MKFLNKHNLLYQHQHAFRAKLSTETQLLEFSDDMLKTMYWYNGHQSDIVIMDFSEAFDKVLHSGLLFKLSELGASEEVCQWAKSFLVSRTQRVVVDGVASECEAVTSGVPQGSVLGPIFFLVYINDMAKCSNHFSVRLFADDTIIYKAVKSVSDCEFLQEDLDALESWAKEWTMEFHPDKCSIMCQGRKTNCYIITSLKINPLQQHLTQNT